MTDNFPICLPWVLESEGGNDDDPDDPGGRTSRGITQSEYNAYCDLCGMARGDVWKASQPSIMQIYRQAYWQPYCGNLPAGVDCVFFDIAVNMGTHEAILLLQRAVGVAADGHIGTVTSSAIRSIVPSIIVNRMSDERIGFYRSLRTFRKYGRGWLARVEFCRKNALYLADAKLTKASLK